MWVIILGDFSEGLEGVVGPFENEDKAQDYADSHNLGHWDKIMMEVEEPFGVGGGKN